jgi:DNA mismatch repair protein MutH
MQTIDEILAKLQPIIGQKHKVPITANKGRVGHFLEKLLGIPHTPNCLDCVDGELKTFPLKKLKNGTLVPKETLKVTSLSEVQLKKCDFEASRCCKKLAKMLLVPYYRTGETIEFMAPRVVDRSCKEFSEFYKTFEADYNAIRKLFLETTKLKCETGALLQNRPWGGGHGSTTRAFYLRREFMNRFL